MKTQIRKGTFETNSSSVHSLVMCNKSDYDKWEQGKVFLFRGSGYAYPDGNKPQKIIFIQKKKQSPLKNLASIIQILHTTQKEIFWIFFMKMNGMIMTIFGMNGAKIGKLLKNHSQQRMVILLLRLAMMDMTADKI